MSDEHNKYSKYFEYYHKQRVLYSTGKDKYKKCKGCSDEKIFEEKNNTLKLNCGSKGDNECGDQFEIILPIYKDYYEEIERLNKIIHGSFKYDKNINNIENYDLEKLDKCMNITEKLSEKKDKIEDASLKLKELQNKYIKENKLKDKNEKIQELYNIKKKQEEELNKIMKGIRDPLITDDKKNILKKEYAKTIYDNQRAIYELMNELKENNNDYVKVKEEEITIMNEINIKEKKEKKEKKNKGKDITDINNYLGQKGYDLCKELSETKFPQEEIDEKRKKVYDEIMKEVKEAITNDNYKDLLKDKEIKLMFESYDKHFFNNKLSGLSKESDCQWVICWNNRCTKTAGRQRCRKDGNCKIIEIELSAKVFVNVINKMIKEGKDFVFSDDKNNCDSILTCLQLTFEHELIHGLQGCFCGDWMYKNGPGDWSGKTGPGSGHSKTFMSILNNKFGHVDFRHKLFSTGDEKIKEQIKKDKKSDKLGDRQEEIELEIAKDISKKENDTIKYYSKSKDNKWLSTFNVGNPFEYDGYTYPTVEHAFHAQKIDPDDTKSKEYKEKFTDKDLKPNEAKKLGGKKSFKENNYKLRKDWDKIKLRLMKEITETYYKNNSQLLDKLLSTKNKELLHSGPRIDDFWGVNKNGGENHHGKILMEIRKNNSYKVPKKLTKEGKEWLEAAVEDMKERENN